MKIISSILLIALTLSSCILDYPAKRLPKIEYCEGCTTAVSYDENGVRHETTSCPGHIPATENPDPTEVA